MKPDRIALIRAAAAKKRRKVDPPPVPYLKTGHGLHTAVPNWNFRMVRK